MIDLAALPPGAAHAVEAWRRAEHAVSTTRAHWHAEYVAIHDALTDPAHRAATDAIARIRAGAAVRERPPSPAPVPERWAAARINGVWR